MFGGFGLSIVGVELREFLRSLRIALRAEIKQAQPPIIVEAGLEAVL